MAKGHGEDSRREAAIPGFRGPIRSLSGVESGVPRSSSTAPKEDNKNRRTPPRPDVVPGAPTEAETVPVKPVEEKPFRLIDEGHRELPEDEQAWEIHLRPKP